eukprot:6372617-Ditylum_brightwellii.AAC.1
MKTNPFIRTVLISKIQKWCGDDTTSPGIPTDPLGVLLTEVVVEQNDLGWENLMKGRISKKWGITQPRHCPMGQRTDTTSVELLIPYMGLA